jgi:hypothetical protein
LPKFPHNVNILAFYTAKAKIDEEIKQQLLKLGYYDELLKGNGFSSDSWGDKKGSNGLNTRSMIIIITVTASRQWV